jgi:glycosyltransferase involved in cell wall biosynthesis
MVREAIGDHAAGLVPVGDAPALAGALHRVLTDPNAAQASARAARRRFDERFTPEVVAAALAHIYDRAVVRLGGRRSWI